MRIPSPPTPPSFFSSSRRRQVLSGLHSCRLPPSAHYSRRARDSRTILQFDYKRHPAPCSLKSESIPPSMHTRPDRGTFCRPRRLPVRSLPQTRVDALNHPLVMLTWAVRIHPQRLLVPAPDAVSPTHPPPPALPSPQLTSLPRRLAPSSPPLVTTSLRTLCGRVDIMLRWFVPSLSKPSLRAHCPSGSLHPYLARIPPYLRSDLRRTNNVNRYPPQLSILFSGSL
jgi:hypothetical protein